MDTTLNTVVLIKARTCEVGLTHYLTGKGGQLTWSQVRCTASTFALIEAAQRVNAFKNQMFYPEARYLMEIIMPQDVHDFERYKVFDSGVYVIAWKVFPRSEYRTAVAYARALGHLVGSNGPGLPFARKPRIKKTKTRILVTQGRGLDV